VLAPDRITHIVKWTATVIVLVGALCTSLRLDPVNIWLLNVGTGLFVIWAFRIGDTAMITVNTGLLLIYLFGLYYSR
jgi:hypothetical protein